MNKKAFFDFIKNSQLINKIDVAGVLDERRFNKFFVQAFLPPLFILAINKLILFVIFSLSRLKRQTRKKPALLGIPNPDSEYSVFLCLFEYVDCAGTGSANRNKHIRFFRFQRVETKQISAELLLTSERRLLHHTDNAANSLRIFLFHNTAKGSVSILLQSNCLSSLQTQKKRRESISERRKLDSGSGLHIRNQPDYPGSRFRLQVF